MKNLTTSIIALFTIASSVLADNTNPATIKITAALNNNTVAVCFTAANNTTIEIERSFYSNNFTTIATFTSIFGGNMQVKDNSADLAGRKVAAYRIKTTNADGTVTYSNAAVVKLSAIEGVAASKSIINFTADQNGNADITVKNAAGKTVAVTNTIVSNGSNTVEVANGLAKGFYTATVSVNGVIVATEKIIAE